jgi:hypothetical protein
MAPLTWDAVADRLYETGVDHGVYYPLDESGDYTPGVAWNGLETVTESPAGAEATATYADNIKYLNLISAETFGGTVEAYTYPDEFAEADGTAEPTPGVRLGQQSRKTFGMCYRTILGNAVEGNDFGFKLHLLYGLTASPSEKAYASVNDSPEAISFSWDVSSIPAGSTDPDLKPTSVIVIDSTKVDGTALTALMDELYGTAGDPRLPTPDEVIAMFSGAVTVVDMGAAANQPTYNAGTHVVTLPTVTGVTWTINGTAASPGAQPAMTTGQTSHIVAHPTTSHVLEGDTDWEYDY